MIRIEVDKPTVTEKHGTSAKGRPYTIREQVAYAHVIDEDGKPGKYPVKCRLSLGDDQPPYAPGMYTLAPASVKVGDYDRLELDRVQLVPVAAAQKAA